MAAQCLEKQILDLYRSGIYVGVQATPSGFLIWMCDRTYTRRVDHVVPDRDPQPPSIAAWLHASALENFPDSPYAQNIAAAHGLAG